MNLRNKMLAMLDSTRVEENYEIAGKLLIVVSIALTNHANVYIVAENDLHIYVRLFKSWGLTVCKVVCVQPKDFKKVDDVEIIVPQDLLTDKTPRKFFFLFHPDCSSGELKEFFNTRENEIPSAQMRNMIFNVLHFDALKLHGNVFPFFDSNRTFYYQSHKKDLIELFDSLADETSQQALYYFVEAYVLNCPYKGEHIPTRWKYFFGDKYERLYKHLDGECWINCGASIGDTIFAYLSFDFKPKKIYAFEGDKNTYNVLLENLFALLPEERALIEPFNEMITAETDFEKILAGNKCTLLNADIEGAELKLLRAMKKIIQADRPVIAVCVYHWKEDMFNVSQFLQSICENYVFYMRKYTCSYRALKNCHEIVFYAVPIERSYRS